MGHACTELDTVNSVWRTTPRGSNGAAVICMLFLLGAMVLENIIRLVRTGTAPLLQTSRAERWLLALLAALHAFKAAGVKPPINIVLVCEGEEEIGSPNFPQIIFKPEVEAALRKSVGVIIPLGNQDLDGSVAINLGAKGIDRVSARTERVIELGSAGVSAQVSRVATLVEGIENRYIATGLQAAARISLTGAQAALTLSERLVAGDELGCGGFGAAGRRRGRQGGRWLTEWAAWRRGRQAGRQRGEVRESPLDRWQLDARAVGNPRRVAGEQEPRVGVEWRGEELGSRRDLH